MIFREAALTDIAAMHHVRLAVRENVLSNPALVTEADYAAYLSVRGKGWVCETGGAVVGFAIIDLQGRNVWALFVHPECEGRGIGKRLHQQMMAWYFSQSSETIWLSTAPGTRADAFYRAQGWRETGPYGEGEIGFEMAADGWQNN